MFTGLVQDLGTISAIENGPPRRFTVATQWDASNLILGASVAHAGCCLTVVDVGLGWHVVEVSDETLRVTTLGAWAVGTQVNLERSLRMGDELGGHLVTGHVDGLGRLIARHDAGGYTHMRFAAPDDLAPMIAAKGSITIDGVSLTVNRVDGAAFEVAIIPHTAAVTTLGTVQVGDAVHLEVDLLARYIARQLACQRSEKVS
jgi:riboflavin synthase